MERVDELVRSFAGTFAHTDEEVTGHPDAVQADPDPPADFDHEHAQRDRQTQPAIHDVREEGVARIAVVARVPGERPLHEEHARQPHRGPGLRERKRGAGEIIEPGQPGVDVRAVRRRGDQQRTLVERRFTFDRGDQHPKPLCCTDVHRGRPYPREPRAASRTASRTIATWPARSRLSCVTPSRRGFDPTGSE